MPVRRPGWRERSPEFIALFELALASGIFKEWATDLGDIGSAFKPFFMKCYLLTCAGSTTADIDPRQCGIL